ncbi:MAG: response regulator, partial [Acidobacteriota bacterium]
MNGIKDERPASGGALAMHEPRILVVDEDQAERLALAQCLSRDYQVLQAVSGKEAIAIIEHDEVDVILTDLRLTDVSGLEVLMQARVSQPEAVRILITEYAEFQDMVRIINEAAVYQFVPRPWHPNQLLLLLRRALESRELARRHRYLSREMKFADTVMNRQNDGMVRLLKQSYEFDKLVFVSEQMLEVCNLAKRAAESNLPILIQGETGTGKELMARAVH